MRHTLSIFTGAALAALFFLSPVHASECTLWHDSSMWAGVSAGDDTLTSGDNVQLHNGTVRRFNSYNSWTYSSVNGSTHCETAWNNFCTMNIGSGGTRVGNICYNNSGNYYQWRGDCYGGTGTKYPYRRQLSFFASDPDPATLCPSSIQETPTPPTDSDGDGWPDEIDPWPNDPTPKAFGPITTLQDANGDTIGGIYDFGEYGQVYIGQPDGMFKWHNARLEAIGEDTSGLPYGCPGCFFTDHYWKDPPYNTLTHVINAGDGTSWDIISKMTPLDPIIIQPEIIHNPVQRMPMPQTGDSHTYETGDRAQAGSSDSQLLSQVVDNTGKTVDGIKGLSDLLKDIRGNQERQLVQGRQTGGSTVVTSGPTAAQSAEFGTAYDGAMSGLQGDPEFDGTIDEADLPEERDWAGMMTGFLNTNPVSSWLSGSSIVTESAVCVVSGVISTGGQTWTLAFDFCQWAYIFEGMGVVLLSLSYLIGIMMVVRR
jgi:hypothetical protein